MRWFVVFLLPICAFACGGCGKQTAKAPENTQLIHSAPDAADPALVPPPDAFVIQEQEFAVIRAFMARRSGSTQTYIGPIKKSGYPPGISVADFLNGEGNTGDFRYTDLDRLQLIIGGDTLLELRSEDITKVRGWIAKYWEWRKTSQEQHLGDGVPKPLGRIGYPEFTFITPNVLRVGGVRLEEKGVESLWKHVTTELPVLRVYALERIKTASRMIDEEDARRVSANTKTQRDRAVVDAALK